MKAVITDMLSLQYSRQVNGIGVCSFAVAVGHPAIAEIVKNYRVEVWRKTASIEWYCEEVYIVRKKRYQWNGKTSDLIVTAVSGNWLLSSRIVAWKAATANRSTFAATKAETIAKELVKYNLSSYATVANGRVVAGNTANTVQADSAGGNVLDINCAWDKLLATLQDISRIGGGDFTMFWTGTVWDFRWYAGQLGTDRSTSLIFSLERGNLDAPSLTQDWMEEKSLAIVAGQGEGASRMVRTRQGVDWSADNQIEIYVDARDVQSGSTNESDVLDDRADAALDAASGINVMDFKIVQTVASRYGAEYFLGDIGTVVYSGVTATVKIETVSIDFSSKDDEVITVGVSNA